MRFRGSLALRILALNILVLVLLGGSVFYLDGFRQRLLAERRSQQEILVQSLAATLADRPLSALGPTLARLNAVTKVQLRLYGPGERLLTASPPELILIDPRSQVWQKHVARAMDRIVDGLVAAEPIPAFAGIDQRQPRQWREFRDVAAGAEVASTVRYAPDRTHVISAATRLAPGSPITLIAVENARDVVRLVRAERLRLGQLILVALAVAILLSLFLARTIVDPLRRLAVAAVRVRLGRERGVVVPRLEGRADEIGLLARAVSDMTTELRERIDATESFAGDVSHELKNPIASMRSALDAFERVEEPGLRAQLLAVLRDDVARFDRLISDVAEISRLDAQLTRTPFARVDLGEVVETMLRQRERGGLDGNVRIAFARPGKGLAAVVGDADRLGRAVGNLVDNAVSFSPPNGVVRVGAALSGGTVVVSVEDQGPGVPEEARERIFERFHSDRSDGERHSGLGLAIARTIVDGHGGTIGVSTRDAGGARFTIRLPAAS